MDLLNDRSGRRCAALVLVVALHLALFQMLAPHRLNLQPSAESAYASFVLERSGISSRAANSQWPLQLARPAMPDVSAPPIAFVQTASAAGPGPGSQGIDTPPRPDPLSPNAPLVLPAAFHNAAGQAVIVVLVRALVLADGSVGVAEVAGSCGIADLDALALREVKARWRFVPATLHGVAVADWITTEVVFRG